MTLLAREAMAAPIATVQSATSATLKRRSATFATLNGRTPLNAGDVVRTGANGKANLLFVDGSQLRLGRQTTVEITAPVKASGGRKSFFRALGGEVYARMRPGSAAKTRTAVAGVRGTEILLQVDEGDGTTTLTVIEGVVDFYNEFGAVVVNVSQQSTAAPGKAPSTPITINNPGLLIEWTFDLDFVVVPREKFWVSRNGSTLQAELAQAQNSPRDLGDVLFDLRRYEAALASYQQAENAAPNNGEIALRIGYALLELGRLDEAEIYFRRALGEARAAKVPQPSFQLIAAFDEPAADNDDSLRAFALVGLAWLELARNRTLDAQGFAQRALEITPRSAEAHIVSGVALLRQNNKLDEAINAFDAALQGAPSTLHYQARAWKALALLAQNNNAGALKEAQTATLEAPDSGLARGHLALALLFNDRARDASREARLAVKLNPDAVAARVALAQALLAKGDADAAAREAAVASALDSQLPQGLYILGLADAARRDYSHAARSLQKSLEIAPEFLPAASALARIYTLMGREGEARTLLTDYQTRYPNSGDVLAALGQVYYQQGSYREAAEQYKKAAALQPDSALLQAELARLLLDDNQLSEALKAGQRAVFLAPQVGQYHALLGLIADFSGLSAFAEREYRTAIALDPQNALARARIGLNNAADPRTGFNTTTQAFLYDPAISRQLFRGGIQAETTVSGGSDNSRSIFSGHRWQSKNGKIYDYGIESANSSSGFDDAPNDDTRQYGIQELVNIVPNNRTNILLRGSATKNEFGANAPETSFDNRFENSLPRASIAARQRIGSRHYLWAGVRYDSIRSRNTDPNSDSNFFDYFPPFFLYTENQELRARVIEPEVRLDLNLSGAPGRSTLTFGASYARQRTFLRQDITAQGPFLPVPLGQQTGDGTRRVSVFYAQLAQRVGNKSSFVAQVRRQDIGSTFSTNFLGTPLLPDSVTDTSTLLPSLLVNHQLDKKTTLRFFANRSKFDSGLQSFAPTETLLSSEASVFSTGSSDTTRLYSLEIERYFSPRTFGKVFAFRSRSDLLSIGNITLGQTRRTGVGVRLEHRVGSNLFANLLISYNRTTSETPESVLFGEVAPYQPRHFARLGLNYVSPSGNKAGIAVNNIGSFFQDTNFSGVNRTRFPSKTTVDLRLAREPSLKNEVFLNVVNLFNARQISFNSIPAPGRRFEVGYTRRF